MRRLVARLRGLLAGAYALLLLYVVAPPFVLHAWLTRRIDLLYRVALAGVALGLRLAGVRIEVTGEENFVRHRPCVYMANHQSNLDPPVLFVVLPPRVAFMGKKSLFSIPILGTMLRLGDFVPVHREAPEEARASIDVALEKLQKGTTLVVYPEGRRSVDGRLQRFKHGVFLLALRAGAPIVPITLVGADRVMRKTTWELYPGVVRVTVHPPIETRGRSVEERRKLGEEVRAVIASALPADRRAPAAPEASGPAAAAPDDAL